MSMSLRRIGLLLGLAGLVALVGPPVGRATAQTSADALVAPASPLVTSVPKGSAETPAGSTTDSECDRIAALRLPFASTTAVQETRQPDWARGVVACQEEVRQHPGDMHLLYQLGRAEDHTHNYIAALHDYKSVVDAGNAEAMVDLGALYYYGHGVLQSYTTAFDYFTKAQAAGSNRALADLAAMYGDGAGVPRDDAKSLDYAEQAVEAGNPFGLKIIADHYFNGAGVPRSYPMSAQYLQQAADLGDGQSMKFLANMYESGYLGRPNPAKAGELRLRAQKVDPDGRDPIPVHLPMLRQSAAQPVVKTAATAYHRRYVVYRYNPVWQAAPGDNRCCPNNMLVCPLGRHFCGH